MTQTLEPTTPRITDVDASRPNWDVVAKATALVPMIRHYGGPSGWQPHPAHLFKVARRNAPNAAAEAIEWGTRRHDLFNLGQFTSPTNYGIYYMAQPVAAQPQKNGRAHD